ncbi:hypothetical protein HNY73_003899 [Argiope bruennichi]|uniref:Uncharacterized protein n=1 Tax=Argiope bruennichi TaxID=94029 RepID=A0A8T0FNY9_ARGBR|nr:hypothetical protein HNY73_003899 [Argiope bruennichi]
MYVFPPKLQDLSTWSSKSRPSNSKEVWEISAPPDHSLYWSLVLSFVIASPEKSDWMERLLGTEKEIKELMLKKNIKGQKLVPQNIKKQVMNFNPFKNQHSFYHNKDMTNIFRMFSLRLKRAANQMSKKYTEGGDDLKLRAATKMLKCCIEVYETDSEGNKLPVKINAPVVGRDTLVLFKHSGVRKQYKTMSPSGQDRDHKVIDTFAFGMSLNHVIPLRRDALGHILKRTDINHEIIRELQQDFTGNGNFLVSLMIKNSRMETVPSIYASPYIAWKLEAAGFVTDPCSSKVEGGGGLSAFYHCLGRDSTLLLRVLYDYASNSFEHSDNTTRNPDTEILRALIRIGDALQNDHSKSKGFSMLADKKGIAVKSYEEILSFNEFQRRVVEKIAALPRNCSPQVPQMMMMVVESTVTDENQYRVFQNFIQRSEYYENLDNYSCLLFFDNFLFLDLPSDIMNSAVQNLFLTVFGYKLFRKCVHGVHCTKHDITPEDSTLRVIPFIFRSKFLESAKAVEEKLKFSSPGSAGKSPKYQSRKEKNPNSVLMQVTSGLKNLPEIKDEFLIARLRNYLDIATNITITDVDMKGVLAIERALQVIGETLNTSESSSVIGHLLCSCLPQCAIEEFFRIRNHCLSKYRSRVMGRKIELGKRDPSQCDNANKDEILHILQDLDKLSKNFESKANSAKQMEIEISNSEYEEIIRIVSNFRNIIDNIFSDVKECPMRIIDHSVVANFFSDARSFSWFTDEEMTTIKEKISEQLQSSRKAKASLKEFLKKENQLSEEEAQQLLFIIFAAQKDKKCISANLSSNPEVALKALDSIEKDEQDIFKKNNDREDDIDCLMKFTETDEGNHLLLKMDFSDNDDLQRKVLEFLNRKVEFLLDRISYLKAILIEEDEEILSLWNWGKSEAIKTHTRYLMRQRYRREKDVRASLEMLLFDCMNILKTRSSLSRLWSKANDLFSGVSLRDILSHGSTILEIVGGYLDQDDLPSHFIDKMLELIEDGDALRTLSDLWGKNRITDLKQFQRMLDADDPSLREVQKWRKKDLRA